jgi:hypothetical protein
MRYRLVAILVGLLSFIGSALVSTISNPPVEFVAVEASTASPSGSLEVYLKAREAADAPNNQKVTLYQSPERPRGEIPC